MSKAASNSTPECSEEQKSQAAMICEYIKLFCGTCVVILLVMVAFTGIGNQWCVLQIHPAALFCLLFFGIILLAYIEALHYACKDPRVKRPLQTNHCRSVFITVLIISRRKVFRWRSGTWKPTRRSTPGLTSVTSSWILPIKSRSSLWADSSSSFLW